LVAGGNRAHARWSSPEDALLPGRAQQFVAGAVAKNIEVFNEQGEAQQLRLFPSDVEPPALRDPAAVSKNRSVVHREIMATTPFQIKTFGTFPILTQLRAQRLFTKGRVSCSIGCGC
jgi:hypothetical protein